jgi:glycosidase
VAAAALLLLCAPLPSASAKRPEPIPIHWTTAGVTDTLWVRDLIAAKPHHVRVLDRGGLADLQADHERLILRLAPGARGVFLPRLRFDAGVRTIAVAVAPRRAHLFRWQAPPGEARAVRLFGTMNGWNRESLPLLDEDGDGIWERVVPLEAGRYEYKYWVDDKELLDPAVDERVANGFGGYNNVLVIDGVGLEHPPQLFWGGWHRDPEDGSARLGVELERRDDPGAAERERLVALWDDAPLPARAISETEWGFALRLNDRLLPGWLEGEHALRLLYMGDEDLSNQLRLDFAGGRPAGIGAGDAEAETGTGDAEKSAAAGPALAASSERDSFQWPDAILYSLVTDRFRNGDPSNDRPVRDPELGRPANWHGGDLAGIRWAIDSGYFDSLGVDALWISPLNQAADGAFREYPEPHRLYSGYHGYWPVEPRRVEPRFGTVAEARALADALHRHRMALLLDLVTNHVHQEHPYYQQHPEWFGDLLLADGTRNLRRFDEERLTTWFEPYLPAFDYLGSPEAVATMVDDAVWWLGATHADGFRHDATKHVPARFWRQLTAVLERRVERASRSSVLQIGETFGSDALVSSYVNPGQQDSQFDFATYYIARAAFADPNREMRELGERMMTAWRHFGAGHLMGNLMDSHDQVRFATLADGDVRPDQGDAKELGWSSPPRNDHASTYRKVELFLAWVLTAPGLPVLYYGDEIAMAGVGDPDNRRMMRFGTELTIDERRLLQATREWCAMRRQHIALRRGDLRLLHADRDLLVFSREHPLQRLVVALNRGAEPHSFRVEIHQGETPVVRARDLRSRVRPRLLEDHLSATVPPLGARIIELLPAR